MTMEGNPLKEGLAMAFQVVTANFAFSLTCSKLNLNTSSSTLFCPMTLEGRWGTTDEFATIMFFIMVFLGQSSA